MSGDAGLRMLRKARSNPEDYRYKGIIGMQPRDMPTARVKYADGQHSVRMALGNAVDYARMFGGEVVDVESSSPVEGGQGRTRDELPGFAACMLGVVFLLALLATVILTALL